MGRPWEYPRWRRVAMQAGMWLIFGCTLGLAQLLSIHRTNAADSLGGTARIDGYLVRLPAEWTFTRITDPEFQGVQGFDPNTHRQMQVLVLPIQALRELTESTPRGRAPAAGKIAFSGLHRTGILRLETQSHAMPKGGSVLERRLTATVALPPHDGIIVQLLIPAEDRLGSADTTLVRAIAAAITPAPAAGDEQDDSGQ